VAWIHHRNPDRARELARAYRGLIFRRRLPSCSRFQWNFESPTWPISLGGTASD